MEKLENTRPKDIRINSLMAIVRSDFDLTVRKMEKKELHALAHLAREQLRRVDAFVRHASARTRNKTGGRRPQPPDRLPAGLQQAATVSSPPRSSGAYADYVCGVRSYINWIKSANQILFGRFGLFFRGRIHHDAGLWYV